MIKNIIFDFGDIFINLDKPAIFKAFEALGMQEITPEIQLLNDQYEKGLITSQDIYKGYQSVIPDMSYSQFEKAWNSILLDFPEYRLEFIERLTAQKNHRLFLLSNTNEIHIDEVVASMKYSRFKRFQNCFEKFYLTFEMGMKKPDVEIYQFVCDENRLTPNETLFIDDTEANTNSASTIGIHTWNLIPGKDEIVNLFDHPIFN